jgi:phospholipid-binding lipoprotein MlaA
VDGIKRENEDFGQTLGFYGLGPGPYLVLPIFGPSNLRDTGGLAVDSLAYSFMMQQLIGQLGMNDTGEEALYWGLTGLSAIDQRHLQSFRYYMTGSPFEYTLVRKLSQVRRQFLVEH